MLDDFTELLRGVIGHVLDDMGFQLPLWFAVCSANGCIYGGEYSEGTPEKLDVSFTVEYCPPGESDLVLPWNTLLVDRRGKAVHFRFPVHEEGEPTVH